MIVQISAGQGPAECRLAVAKLSGLRFVYMLPSLPSAMEFFNTVLGSRRDLRLVRENAHIHKPVLSLMVFAERAFAYPQNRPFQPAQIMLCAKADRILGIR